MPAIWGVAVSGMMAFGLPARAAELISHGVFYWDEDLADFGGFSGLVIADDGATLYAASDRGELFRAAIARDGSGRIAHVETRWQGRFLDNFAQPVDGFTADAEGLAIGPEGTVFVAFESYARVAGFHPPDMTPQAESYWDRFRQTWGNEGFEALAIMPDGQFLVIQERPADGAAGYPTFLGRNGTWVSGPELPVTDDFHAVGADFGPDGMLYLLERRTDLLARFSSRIRRFAFDGRVFDTGETLLSTEPGALDNMEGISLWTDARGRVIISLISDDNFLIFQNTLIVEYNLIE
jgi:hypothetical protein